MKYHYVWLLWSAAFLVPWLALYAAAKDFRDPMLRVSALTSLLGLTEPLFVPEYWNPPSLFDLAQRTGFDIESLVFSFAIGGIGAAAYSMAARRPLQPLPGDCGSLRGIGCTGLHSPLRRSPSCRCIFYPGIRFIQHPCAGDGWRDHCTMPPRPRTWHAARWRALRRLVRGVHGPADRCCAGYIEQVWNLPALSGIRPAGIPIEELAFGFAFGSYWAAVYEHLSWTRVVPPRPGRGLNAA